MAYEEDQRSQAILAFLGAGLQQPPDRALAVTALGNARRAVAAQKASEQSIETWLAEQVRHGGIRENAATLAVLELSGDHHRTTQAYANRHPDRITALDQLIGVIR
jgi:phytoene dehydrogenase-like protein